MSFRRGRHPLLGMAALAAIPAISIAQTTYYVSPTGNDDNSGTSPSSPWASLTKVDDTDFAPGSTILFQDGGNWYGSLTATSSGTASDPITYGSYGSAADPIFWGSNPISAASFQSVAGESDTYTYSTSTTVDSFLVNHQFFHSSSLVSGQSTDASNISYVESNPDTWYYDSSSDQLYVNTGGAITSSNAYTAVVRPIGVDSNGQSNLVFDNLTVEETAVYNGGYGFYADGGSNVTFENSTSIAAGKHAFVAIDTTGFLGKNLTASNLMPDQGNGGATAYVSYADPSVTNTTNTWKNISYTDADDNYPAFYSHLTTSATNPTPIGQLTVNGLYVAYPGATGGSAIGVSTSGSEQVTITGAVIENGSVSASGNNIMLDRLIMNGAASQVDLVGNNNVLQNSLITGDNPNWEAGHNGSIVVQGTDNIIRYNTVNISPTNQSLGAVIGLQNSGSGTQIYGNIFDTPAAAYLQTFTGDPGIDAFNNLYAGTSNPQVIYADGIAPTMPLSDWPSSDNSNAIYSNPEFVNASNGVYYLEPGSPAIDAFDPAAGQSVGYDVYGQPRPAGATNFGAIQTIGPIAIWNNAGGSGDGVTWANSSENWNNGTAVAAYSDGDNVIFDDSNNGNYSVALNSTVQPGSVLVYNNSGNYTIGGSGSIAGSGSLTKSGFATLTLATVNTYSGGTIINSGTLIAEVSGALPNGGSVVNNDTLDIEGNETLGASGVSALAGTGTLNIGNGAPAIVKLAAGSGAAFQNGLTIASGAALDIGNNSLILSDSGGSIDSTIRNYLIAGYSGGNWNGAGLATGAIITSSPTGTEYGIGYADGADGGIAGIGSGQLEVMYTLYGDTNLDGVVNSVDFGTLAANFGTSGKVWDQGDFTYDGVINAVDFGLLAQNFGKSLGGAGDVLTAEDWAALDAFAAANGLMTYVPEPGSALMMIAGFGVLRRRRRPIKRFR